MPKVLGTDNDGETRMQSYDIVIGNHLLFGDARAGMAINSGAIAAHGQVAAPTAAGIVDPRVGLTGFGLAV